MFRIWLLSLLACTACTDGPVRSGTVAESADFLPTISDTTPEALSTGSEDDTLGNREQPRLVLRCEEGRVGAYLIVGTVAEVESGQVDDRAVPVRLDSTPRC
ncbi:MAG TPA: hypothetical protein VGR09_14430 [Gemmatimonadales bacterium]|nr:hypothetical protein [Gemmatimonadales bacterium]